MGNPTATLERENLSAMNAQVPQLDDPERPRAATLKFTYPSGARPLEGYTIKRGVGRGGFGEVYFATSDAGKEVALKLIRRNLDVELRGVSQCLNLKHPNLIALYDIKTDEMGDQWVVMEYVSGESLEDLIDRCPQGIPEDQMLSWMRGLCAGVAYLHDHGIVHRDLKPGNIFSDDGMVKIGDYGLAKFISCSRRSGQTESVGTVHYMAPEIANGRYGREIDTYALGIILFEMLTGHVPFEGESVGEVLMKHLTAEPDLSVLQEPYRDIVKRALAKDPNVRLKNVGELVALLPGGGDVPPAYPRVDVETVILTPVASPEVYDSRPPKQGSPASKPHTDPSRTGQPTDDQIGEVEEPIAKALRSVWTTIDRRWRGDHRQPLNLVQKCLLVAAVFYLWSLLTASSSVSSIGLLVRGTIIYAIYYAFWATIIRPGIRRHTGEAALAAGSPPSMPPRPQPAPPPSTLAADQLTADWKQPTATGLTRYEEAQRRRRSRTGWRDRVNQQLATKPLREKLTELLGSMLLAAVFAAIASSAVPLLYSNQPTSETMATYVWLTVVATLGSWAVLIPSKFVEGKLEDQVPMRITLMLLGALLGLAAWGIADGLMLNTNSWSEPIDVHNGLVSHEMLGWAHVPTGTHPSATFFVAYFAFLFVLPRWWRRTEYTRSTRLSLWSVLTCIFTAWLLHIFWWFPQPLGLLTAGVIALATQLASPWMPPSQRRAISESAEQAVTS